MDICLSAILAIIASSKAEGDAKREVKLAWTVLRDGRSTSIYGAKREAMADVRQCLLAHPASPRAFSLKSLPQVAINTFHIHFKDQ